MGVLLPVRDPIARKVDQKQEITDICNVLKHNCCWFFIEYWQEADLTPIAAPRKQNHFSGPGQSFTSWLAFQKNCKQLERLSVETYKIN
jgi:hypothetical protein